MSRTPKYIKYKYVNQYGVEYYSTFNKSFISNITLPSTPKEGMSIIVKDSEFNAQNYPVLVRTLDSTILRGDPSILLDVDGFDTEFYFNGNNWSAVGR